MKRRAKSPEPRRAKGWTAYDGYGGDPIIKADGELSPMVGYPEERPATEAEIAMEQAKRAVRADRIANAQAFQIRPEWRDADDIRSTIECMEYDNHPLDNLTPEEWRALRIKICGPRERD